MVTDDASGMVAALGNFDGVHLGHRVLISAAARVAAAHGSAPAVVVFDPHPRRYFRPNDPPFLITAPDDRDALLREAGAAAVVRLRFNDALASLSPEDFVQHVLRDQLRLAGAVTGADFRFGRGRAGDVDDLARLCADVGLDFAAIDPLRDETEAHGLKIGSSGVRAAIAAGELDRATAMLGRRWSVAGIVREGRRLGRTIGFPTANLILGDLISPAFGVYAVLVAIDGRNGARAGAVANFGVRPTLGGDATPLLEVHLFDFDADIYGAKLRVEFVAFIRGERKFADVEALRSQIALDADAARRILRDGA
ncbi:MAG: bifunctional riboflavin kinase/FAD synthetase [Alphaproteobacteria bacterium]|nr:bifunctional riboflavin kinase/FAD synthetase [Alphaproteobacteria bacterium]